MSKRIRILIAMLLCASLGLTSLLLAQEVPPEANIRRINLAWDPNTEPDLDGYKIYYKCCISGPPYEGTEAYQGDSPIIVHLEDLRNPRNPRFQLEGLSKQNDYYFSVTAFDSESNESAFSTEASTRSVSTGESTDSSASSGGGGGGGCFIQSAALFGCAR